MCIVVSLSLSLSLLPLHIEGGSSSLSGGTIAAIATTVVVVIILIVIVVVVMAVIRRKMKKVGHKRQGMKCNVITVNLYLLYGTLLLKEQKLVVAFKSRWFYFFLQLKLLLLMHI